MNMLIYVPYIVLDANKGDCVHVRELAENLSKLGNKVTIICRLRDKGHTGSVTTKRVRAPGIRVIDFFGATICGFFLGAVATRGRKYDLLYTRAGFSASTYLLCQLAKAPYVTEVNGLIWDETKIGPATWPGKAFGYFLDFIEGESYRRSRHVVAVTPQIKERLAAEYSIEPGKITVIPNGANTDLFKPMNTDQARKELNLSRANYLVTFVGHLTAWQGVGYLIKSVPYVIRECPGTKFLIVGDGPLKRELIKLAKQIGVSAQTIFTGMVPYGEAPSYINASDVCVAPFIRARNERCGLSPLKIHEYMACGKPIVASRIANLEHIEQSNAGILVEPENPQELGNAIIKLLKDKSLRQQMGKNGRKYVVENHSWESVAERVTKVCELALAEKRNKP